MWCCGTAPRCGCAPPGRATHQAWSGCCKGSRRSHATCGSSRAWSTCPGWLPGRHRSTISAATAWSQPPGPRTASSPTPAGSGRQGDPSGPRSEEHTSELQSRRDLVCRLLLEKKKRKKNNGNKQKKKEKKKNNKIQ